MTDIRAIEAFLPCATPQAWVEAALTDIPLLLIDHANCEKKAASTAINLLYRYVDRPELIDRMSRLAREELRHFEQVIGIMKRRDIAYRQLTASRYAAGLHQHIRKPEPERLIDTLIVGAFIEARSCERFACIAPHLDEELGDFYRGLLASESRHFTHYLGLARQYSDTPIDTRVDHFSQLEKTLIEAEDTELRFHSGPLCNPA